MLGIINAAGKIKRTKWSRCNQIMSTTQRPSADEQHTHNLTAATQNSKTPRSRGRVWRRVRRRFVMLGGCSECMALRILFPTPVKRWRDCNDEINEMRTLTHIRHLTSTFLTRCPNFRLPLPGSEEVRLEGEYNEKKAAKTNTDNPTTMLRSG